ncbi:NifU family protein [Thermopolyspora sp. NPDC052614]|uniref:NifU family protein n=1 Tax=Thermopolyspora sp. NPDC052614 TaxID=3155682 RepID=UPI0034332493
MASSEEQAAERVRRIDALLDRVGGLPDAEPAVELVRELLDLYGEALSRVLDAGDERLAARLADDDLVGHLLALHDLHPLDVTARVERAVRGTRLGGGAYVQEVEVDGDAVRVRMRRGAGGCGSSGDPAAVLRDAIGNAAPEIGRVEVEELPPPPVVISIDALRRARASTV